MNSQKLVLCAIVWIQAAFIPACSSISQPVPNPKNTPSATFAVGPIDRKMAIPTNAIKISPDTDEHPPLLHARDYEEPVPVPGEVNTPGAEDSPFITPDGNTLYFFFTPDVNVPAEKQILDGVTGIYESKKANGEWSQPKRIILQDSGKRAGDGCAFVLDDIMWFCSAREGYTGMHWFTAVHKDGIWQNWTIANFNPDYQVGELHISGDGINLYFASDRPGGKGSLDIWVSENINGTWQEPTNIAAINTGDSEGWPALNPNGDELWFSRNNSIWRSKKMNGEWQEAELIVSPLAGEPSIDGDGNLYFVHHFFTNDRMIEADIYVAYKKHDN